ncbi:hypothetical protein KC323_g181 [Hortaea werneckii]|nr:hypothetical protein KC323_g181 [Hortaea werneckii]KAI7360228.1 hypothetical protein KC320_g124 [Hortaea werneckii]
MAFLRSPSLHLRSVSTTPSSSLTPSSLAISSSLFPALASSKLLKRNLLHREANGSIILVSMVRLSADWASWLHPGEVFHFFSDNGDAAFVGRVQLEDAGLDQVRTVELLGQREDSRGLAGAWWAVEEHVREVRGLEGSTEDGDGVVLCGDIVE